jgi:hypothetical protein
MVATVLTSAQLQCAFECANLATPPVEQQVISIDPIIECSAGACMQRCTTTLQGTQSTYTSLCRDVKHHRHIEALFTSVCISMAAAWMRKIVDQSFPEVFTVKQETSLTPFPSRKVSEGTLRCMRWKLSLLRTQPVREAIDHRSGSGKGAMRKR